MAAEIFFSDNPSDWTDLEGVYIAEQPATALVREVDLDIVGIAGKTVRGPLDPTFITSPAEFEALYGGRGINLGGAVYSEVWRAIVRAKFGTICIRRVAAGDAAAATKNLSNAVPTAIVRVDASSVGAWGNAVEVAVEAATDADANHFNLRVRFQGKEYLYQNLNTFGTADNLAAVVGEAAGTLIEITKLANGRPANAAYAALTTGSDGTVDDADYIDAITELAHVDGVGICLIAEAPPTPATVNAALPGIAADVFDRVILTWSGVHGQSRADEITDKQAQIGTPNSRICWCFNSPKVLDPTNATSMDVAPHIFMASILSQNDVDVHPGSKASRRQTANVVGIANKGISRGDLILLKKAGISTLEFKKKKGYTFRSAVMTDASELVARREIDFLQLGLSGYLAEFVYEKNTEERRNQMQAGADSYLQNLVDNSRIVEEFKVSTNITSKLERGQGIEKFQTDIRLLGHILHLVFITNIGTGVTIATGETVP